jgi:hypothetical protein
MTEMVRKIYDAIVLSVRVTSLSILFIVLLLWAAGLVRGQRAVNYVVVIIFMLCAILTVDIATYLILHAR